MKIRIKLRLYATLQKYLPPGSSQSETSLELPDISTRQLQDGDILGVFPAIGGG